MNLIARFIAALVLAGVCAAATPQVKPSGVFTNLAFNEEGGDLLGWELLVVPKDDTAFTAFVQVAEGGAPWAGVAARSVGGLSVSLVLPKGSPYAGTYAGKLSAKELVLTMSDGTQQRLLRGKSYWQ